MATSKLSSTIVACLSLNLCVISVFILETEHKIPDELISFLRLLLLPGSEWEKTRQKSKIPKPKADNEILKVALDVLTQRLSLYPNTAEVGFIVSTRTSC